MKKLLPFLSVLAFLGLVFTTIQPAAAHNMRHHHWGKHWGHHHHMKRHNGVMRRHRCHWMNKQVRSGKWRQVRVCTR